MSVSVTAEELVGALRRREATLPAEIGTFVVLEACDAMLASGPRELADLTHVRISEQGATSLSGNACNDEQGARSLHRVLGLLLKAAGSTLAPALARLMEQGPRGGTFSLNALRDELEAALVPLNRNASRRVLARFAREAALPVLEPEDVDAALNSLLGASDQPANDVASRPSHSRITGTDSPLQVDLFEGMELDGDETPFPGAPKDPARPARPDEPRPVAARAVRTPQHESRRSLRPSFAELTEEPRDSWASRKLLLGLLLMVLAIAAVTLGFKLRKELAAPAPTSAERELSDSELGKTLAGDVIVRLREPDAQVLRFVGHAPVTVENLPVGVAHEFVATADGHLPARVLVPISAQWEVTPDGARYEVALQLPEADKQGDALELGPSRLTEQSSATPTRLGSVRVVATPRGARVYQLIGFSPRVELHDLPITGAEELLVYRPGAAPVVRALSPSDFKQTGNKRVADIEVALPAR